MAWVQKTIPPPNEVIPFRIGNFSGGLNNKSSDNQLRDNEAFNLLNMSFFKNGVMEKRKGTVRYVEDVREKPIVFQDVFKPINSKHMIIQATSDELFLDFIKISDIHGVCDGVNYLGKYYFVNGENLYVLQLEDNVPVIYEIVEPPSTNIDGDYNKGDMTFKVKDISGISVDMEIVIETIEGSDKITVESINELTNEITMKTKIVPQEPPEPVTKKLVVTGNDDLYFSALDDKYIEARYKDFISTNKVHLGEDGKPVDLLIYNDNNSFVPFTIGTTETYTYDIVDTDLILKFEREVFGNNYSENEDGAISYLNDFPTTIEFLEEQELPEQHDGLEYDTKDNSLVRLYVPRGEEFTEGIMQYHSESKKAWYEPCTQELDDPYKGEVFIPKKPSYIELSKDRLFISGCPDVPHMVFISDVNNGLYYPVNLPVQVPPNSDKITGLKYFHSAIIIFRKNDIHVLYGDTNRSDVGDSFRLKLIDSHTGAVNNTSIQKVHNYLFFLGSDGVVYSLHTPHTNVDLISTKVISKEIDLFKEPLDFSVDDLLNACSVFYENEYWLSIKDKILVYNYDYMGWTLYNNINAVSFLIYDNDLLIGDIDGKTLKFGVGYADDYLPYTAYWISKRYDFGVASNYKQFKELYIIAHVYDDYVSSIRLNFEIDYVNIRDIPVIKSQLSLWGVAKFGDRFITRNIAPSLPIPIGRRGRVIRFMFGNGYTVDGIFDTYQDILDMEEYIKDEIYFVKDEKKCYIYNGVRWVQMSDEELYQPMRIYEINGDYEVRSKR